MAALRTHSSRAVACLRHAAILLVVTGTGAIGVWVFTPDDSSRTVDRRPVPVMAAVAPNPAQTRVPAIGGDGSVPPQVEARGFDVETAMDALDAETDGAKREELLRGIRAKIAIPDIPTVLADLRHSSQRKTADLLTVRLVAWWAEADPARAAHWISQLSMGGVRDEALHHVATLWTRRDISRSAAWARQLPDEAARQRTLQIIANEAATIRPTEALKLATRMPPDVHRDQVIARALGTWVTRDVENAAQWARAVEDPVQREDMLGKVAAAWAEKDPLRAARFAAEELLPGKPQTDAVAAIVESWARRQPEAAAAWVSDFPPGEIKDAAVRAVASQWTIVDASKAGAWQQQMEGK